MNQEIWEIISVFLLSTVKFVLGSVPMALGFGFSFFETVVVTSLGGFTGVLFFVFSSNSLINNYKKKMKEKREREHKQIKKFTRKNKLIVNIKRKFGLAGIALAAPILLSIPLGCFLAVRYFKNLQKIIAYMFASIVFWSVTSYFLYKPVINAIRTYFF